jgi:phosphatidylethanolamine-binding protein (PEBP) family uncharacterized protein
MDMNFKVSVALGAAVVLGLCAATTAVVAQTASEPGLARLLINNYRPPGKLTVTSPNLQPGAALNGSTFPGLSWTAGPADTKQYAVVVQDTDTLNDFGSPVVVFSIFNIPAEVTKIDAGITAAPAGARFGPSAKGAAAPYAITPATGAKHHYHFQVIALSANATSIGSRSFDEVMMGVRTNVIASGEVVGVE